MKINRVQGCETWNLIRNRKNGKVRDVGFDKDGKEIEREHDCKNWTEKGDKKCRCGETI